jgi:Zn-finger nucleic acid-binding protein
MRLKPDMASFQCDYCQSVYFPDADDDGVRVLGEPSDESCPVCRIPLMNATVANLRICYCTQCHGMSIPMQVFEDLVERLRAQADGALVQPAAGSDDLNRKTGCPRCNKRMDTHLFGGAGNVVIDTCEECCLNWLDRGKLMHIAHAPDERPSESLSEY